MKKLNLKKSLYVGIFALAVVLSAGGMIVQKAAAVGNATVSTTADATVSIDDTSAGGSGSWTPLTGPVLAENTANNISAGTHTISLPTGWEFDTTRTITISTNGTDLRIQNQIITPAASSFSFYVSATSSATPAVLTFSNIRVRPTNTAVASATICHSGAAITGITACGGSQTSFGTLTTTAGNPSEVRVETAANGSGSVVGSQGLTAGNTLTVYAIERDQFHNFIANISPDSWSFSSTSGGVTGSDLSANGANAVMHAHLIGTGVIHAAKSGLSSTDSGTITVAAGAASSLTMYTQPNSTASVDNNFNTQPVVLVQDAGGNPISGATVTASKQSGGGVLRGTTTATSDVNGYATFTNLGYSKTDSVQLHFADGGLTVNSQSFGPLAAGAPTTLTISTGPTVGASVDAPFSGQPQITVTDQYSNPVPNVSVSAAVGSQGAGSLYGTTSETSDSNGHATFTNLGYTKTDAFKVRFSATGPSSVETGSLGPIPAGAAATLTIGVQPAGTGSVDNALTTAAVVHVVDQYGNTVANGTTVTAAIYSGNGSLRNNTATTVSGNATFTNLGYSKSGETFDLVFSSNSHSTGASDAIGPLTAGAITAIKVTTAADSSGVVVSAQDLTAGSSLTVYSATFDQYGNYVGNTAADSWSFTSKTGGVANGDLVAASDKKSATMTGHLVGTGVIHAALAGKTSTDSGTITVVAGSATTLAMDTQPASVSSVDNPFTTQPKVLVTDNGGNPVSGVVVSVALKSGHGAGSLRGTQTATSGVDGKAVFSGLGYNKTDAFQLTFTANGTNSVDSNSVSALAAGAATAVRVETDADGSGTVVPSRNLTAGSYFTVYAVTRDQFGNFVANPSATWSLNILSGGIVSQALAGNGGNATMTGGFEGTATIHAVVGGLSGDSGTITVVHATLDHFVVDQINSTKIAGAQSDVRVTAKDGMGNTMDSFGGATPYTGTVHFTSTDSQATLPDDYTFASDDGGQHTFTNGVTLVTAGSRTVTVNDTDNPSDDGAESVTVQHAGADHFVVDNVTDPVVAGTASNVRVTVKDAYGNTVDSSNSASAYAGTVNVTSTDPQATVGSYTFTGAENGVHTIVSGVTLKTAGAQDVTVVDASNASTTGTQSGITVRHAALDHFVVTASTSTPVAGVPFNLTVTAKDAYGNTMNSANGASPYTGVIFITTSATAPYTLSPSSYPFVSANAGTKTFVNGVTLNATESGVSVSVRDYADASIVGSATGLNVGGAPDTSTLAVTGIDAVRSFAAADGNYADGWKWTFNVTVPTGESAVSFKFADWVSGSNSIPVFANATSNIRIYSAQSSNANSSSSAVYLSGANATSSPMYMDQDLSSNTTGRQVQVTVEARVPVGSASGSYSTSYGVHSEVDNRP